MNGRERPWSLPQPEFEAGHKTPLNVATRRLVKILGKNPDFINERTSLFLSPDVKRIKNQVEMASRRAEATSRPAWQLLENNLLYLQNQVFLRASPFHCDNWLRDSFIGTRFLNMPVLEAHLLSRFELTPASQQLPTTRLFPGDRRWFFDDESTMLGLIWRAKLARGFEPLFSEEKQRWQERWAWIKSHVEDGFYFSPAGTERSWLDTFRLPEEDVLAYNQGIYAAATLAAQYLSLDNSPQNISEAIQGYCALTHPSGRLQFSRKLPHMDCSALFGEYLSLTLFGEPLLPKETVLKTVAMLPNAQQGSPVVVKEDGSYLSPDEFSRYYRPGDYQNGAIWPVFSAAAQAAAKIRGADQDLAFWRNTLTRLQETNHAEYIYTGEAARKTLCLHNPAREHHLWNTVVYDAAMNALGKEKLADLLLSMEDEDQAPSPIGFITEAAQIPDSSL